MDGEKIKIKLSSLFENEWDILLEKIMKEFEKTAYFQRLLNI
ncbi:hypothetical protein ACQKMV_15590 [Lysinibacillus sp. NPDC094403]